MFNRKFNIQNDFIFLNYFENFIMPKINEANWKTKEDKKIVKNYIRKIFDNQWKQERKKQQ
tara:strand:+ start:1149 stop:1331 length:183 start_codon:yes stop_codon:yes gene_type:complete